MNKVDREYCNLLKEILDYGRYKQSRAGETFSLFGRSMRFNLQDGLPLLTTKKVFTKGIIHELLWFLQKSNTSTMNIKYLVDNNVHIWTDDAYRWYCEKVAKHNELCDFRDRIVTDNFVDYCYDNLDVKHTNLSDVGGSIVFSDTFIDDEENKCEYDEECDANTLDKFAAQIQKIQPISKEEFVTKVQNDEFESFFIDNNEYDEGEWEWKNNGITTKIVNTNKSYNFTITDYRFGDLGPIYGIQWRSFGKTHFDQIQNIIDTLKSDPDNRRLLCVAYNPDVLEDVALPPCHVMFQFYTQELHSIERLAWLQDHSNGEYDEWKSVTQEKLDELNVPRRTLSCCFTMRSNDFCCGNPYNICQYAMLTYMLCEVCNMIPGELVYNGGDVHVYTNHIEGAKEQLSRNGSEVIPKLKFNRKVTDINDFKYEDFIIEDYYPDPSIKYELNVGL